MSAESHGLAILNVGGCGYDPHMDNETHTTRYLDLDGDGVPDAVETIELVTLDRTGDGRTDVVAVVEELASGIGIEGVPRRLAVVDEATLALQHTDEVSGA